MKYRAKINLLKYSFHFTSHLKFSNNFLAKVLSKNTILFEVLKNLADENVCGAKADSSETYVGKVLKRNFAEDELRLNGFVLLVAGDKHIYINLDEEHISGLAASASSDLTDWLIKDRKLKVFVYHCRRILYAYKIVGL